MKPIDWKIEAWDGNARAGIIKTRRSEIETPVFMPVGTQATVKGIRYEWLEEELDARIILGNTYHLSLRPGTEIIRDFGGLHKFSTWSRALLTDSGGFQIFSLNALRKLNEEGVEFRSHIDGAKIFMSPEISMEIQAALGAEIVMVLDECPPGTAGFYEIKKSIELTKRWARRSKDKFNKLQDTGKDKGFIDFGIDTAILSYERIDGASGGRKFSRQEGYDLSGKQALFGIIQGARHLDLRKESLNKTVEIGFDGYAIGGLSVGEEKSIMYEVLEFLVPQMPKDKPRYLMGVGAPEDLIEAVYHGVDMFDCVLPTRNGRTGSVFTSQGKLNIRNAEFASDENFLDPECFCSVCKRYSRGYLRHLYRAKEMLAATLISHHNLAFFFDLMNKIRRAIKRGKFSPYRKDFLMNYRKD